ncbi:MAG: aldose 1-epimerase family protein [Eubacteriales bacterium]
MEYTIQNKEIQITVKDEGAELISLILLETGEEYMWDRNPSYWNRTSPILFPFIGGLHEGSYIYNGNKYSMAKHGFLRDTMFEIGEVLEDTMWFSTKSTEETLLCYPFAFSLEIGYRLVGRSVEVIWRIHNLGDTSMEYAIGGHPAFRCPRKEGESRTEYFIQVPVREQLQQTKVSPKGLAMKEPCELVLDNSVIPITEALFLEDALIFEGNQINEIALVDRNKKPYVRMRYDAPVIAVWSMPDTRAGFICFEPWHGLCDVEGIHVPLEQRKWNNHLAPHSMDQKQYTIYI